MTRLRATVLWLLAALAAGSPAASQEKVILPEMGDSAGKYISPMEEREIGHGALLQLRAAGLLVEDPQLVSYLESLGQRVLNGVVDARYSYTFFLVNDPRINAFAAPGGYIGFFSGIILASEREDELASIMAHEIAHVEQRHAARAREAQGKFNLASAAAVVAGLLLGAADPQAGMAAVSAGLAGSAQAQINFTRENEYEADRIGIGFLAEAGFDPDGMADFFGKLAAKEGYGPQIEYLRTHPVSTTRVAEAQARASGLTVRADQSLPDYALAVARLRVLTSAADSVALRRIVDTGEKARGEVALADRYALALALHRLGRPERALAVFDRLLADKPHNTWFRLGRNEVLRDLGRLDTALEDYRHLSSLYPGYYPVVAQYLDALVEAGRYEQAARLGARAVTDHRERPLLYRLLGKALAESGDETGSLEAQAEYFYLHGAFREAVRQLDRALETGGLDHVSRQRINERRSQLRALAQAE